MSESKNWRSIRSYGIILVRNIKENIEPEFLLVCRKSTYCYVDYLLGKYNESDLEYFNFMIENMTIDEREKIINGEYSYLWNDLYSSTRPANGSFYSYVQTKFQRMLPSFKNKNQTLPKFYNSPEWGFPKGRPNFKEDPYDCAVRELYEETRISPLMYNIEASILPFEEKYVGTNGIGYRNVFFIAFPKEECDGFIDENNNAQTREIGSIKWMKYSETMKCFRYLETSKKCILERVNESIKQFRENRDNSNLKFSQNIIFQSKFIK